MKKYDNNYTEQESAWASQMAYCNINETTYTYVSRWAVDNGITIEGDPTFEQIVEAYRYLDINLWNDAKDGESFVDKYDFLENAASSEYGSWKIVQVCDQNEENGLYAVAIETGKYTRNGVDNSVILAVRGSEVVGEQGFLDWLQADANFINSDITEQEKALNEYVNTEFTDLVREKGYTYTAYMGHSLGGYLAIEAAANVAAVNPYLYNTLLEAISIDGPGVTNENYNANKEYYEMIADKCFHYHATAVGSILQTICNPDHYISIKGAADW